MISVIITTCKRPYAVLSRAVESVLNQTYTNLELFVVDDSPGDYEERDAIATQMRAWDDNRLYYIQHDTCRGACAARNTGLQRAQGDFVAFLDDDDEWMPDKLECQLSLFEKDDENLALVYCQYSFVNDDTGEEVIPQEDFIYFKKGYIFDSLILTNYVGSTSYPLIRKSSLIEIGGFDEKMLSCQDYDVWLRLAKKYKFDFVSKPLVRFHIHKADSIGKNPEKRLRGQERLNEKNADYLDANREAAWARNYILIRMYSQNKETGKAFSTLSYTVKKGPRHIRKNIKAFLGIIKDGIKSN